MTGVLVPCSDFLPDRWDGEATLALPALITSAGPAACFAYEEFLFGQIRNPHTRTAYRRAVRRFLEWAAARGVRLEQISPGMIGAYFDAFAASVPTRKLHLAALRHCFDRFVARHVLVLNPAASVRGERYHVVEGLTPEITAAQSRQLLRSINTGSLIGLRDRAVIATLIYTAARAGAVAHLNLRHFVHDGTQYLLRFAEKGGKARAIPVRHDLEQFLREYLRAGGLECGSPEGPLFRTFQGKFGRLTERAITGVDVCRMVKRRLHAAQLPGQLSPHSFRVATVTDLLTQGVPLEDVQYLAGHADPRTTRLYDRRQKKVTRNTVERISI